MRNTMNHKICLGSSLVLLLVLVACGGKPAALTPGPNFALISLSPKPYTISTKPSASTISATFSVPIKTNSTFGVRSNWRGPLLGGSFSFSNGGRTIIFIPQNDEGWLPGEVITVSLRGITSTKGKKLPVYQYRFRAKTNAGQLNDQLDQYQTFDRNAPKTWYIPNIISADFNQDDKLDLAMIGHGAHTSAVTVRLWVKVAYLGVSNYGLPDRIVLGLVTGDFNNDGRLDLAAALPLANQVAVLLASATVGEFEPAKLYDTGAHPRGIAIADFNGDGNLDLVTANLNWNSTVLLGNGDGTFRSYQPLPSAAKGSQDVVVADVNNDGFVDILTTFNDGSEKGVFTNLGNGDGTFRQTGTKQPFTAAGKPMDLATGDFNNDGWLDVVTANDSKDVSLLLNSGKGDGLFIPQPNIDLGTLSAPTQIITVDFNGDGYLDIATVNHASEAGVSVLYGTDNADTFNLQTFTARSGYVPLALAPILPANDQPLSLVITGLSNLHEQLAFVFDFTK